MRSRTFVLCMAVLLCVLSFFSSPARAAEPAEAETVPVGQILYHQSFADVSDYGKSGVRTGSSTAESAEISVKDDALRVRCVDGGRAYTLLPAVRKDSSYTVEFSFRFMESGRENGSVAWLLTCRGDEPTNITSLVIRGNGTVDDFSAPEEALSKAIRGGKWITVTIPVEDGALHRMTLASGEDSCTLERSSVLVIPSGGTGFSFRNTDAAISEIWIVNGVGYEEKTGDAASYATDERPVETAPPKKPAQPGGDPVRHPPANGETAPNTRDRGAVYELAAAISAGSFLALGCGFSSRRHAA